MILLSAFSSELHRHVDIAHLFFPSLQSRRANALQYTLAEQRQFLNGVKNATLIIDYLFNGKRAFRLFSYLYNQLYNFLVSLPKKTRVMCFFWPLTELVRDKPAHKLHEYIRHMLIHLSERFANNQLEIHPQQSHNYSHLLMDKERTYDPAMLTVINHPVREPKNLTLSIIRILWIQ